LIDINFFIMKLFFLTLIIANLAFSQKYVVFENNKKNKAIFDYNDPNSLVSMLVQSRDKIIANVTRDGIITSGVNEEYNLHPIDGMPYFSYPSNFWPFQLADGTEWPLRKINMNESARDMLNRLKSQGEPDFEQPPAQFTDGVDLLFADPELFAKFEVQYVKCGENQEVKQPDFEAIYWVDYPDPAVYLKRSFSKDTLGKFKTSFSQLLFTERLNNKKGFDQKPQVLMSFGSSYEYYENPISQEILDLLKVELAPFSLNKEFSWQQLISNRKGNKISNEDLKKLIHCTDINENGIEY